MNDILPYAILFGVNRHWIELYDETIKELPHWYRGDIKNITAIEINIQIKSIYQESSGGVYSSTHSSSGGNSSSGSYSGGGAGGGGGGSW